jgi:hypothetical protein
MVKTFEGKTKNEYDNVKLPAEMVSEIKRIIETDERLGFTSIQEFVKEAVRRSIVLYGEARNEFERKNIN